MPTVIDVAYDVTKKLPALKAAGVKTVIRYLTPNAKGTKCVRPAEARAIAKAGMHLALVFEISGGSKNLASEINAVTGKLHATFARNYAPKVGAPATAAIYFAIDTGVTQAQLTKYVLPYFAAIRVTLGKDFRAGAYGCGAVCDQALTAKSIDKRWLSNAMGWLGSRQSRAAGRYSILQHLPATVAGVKCDPDEINVHDSDIGDFIPFA